MKKFMCDICKIETKQYDLTEIYSWYRAGGIVDVCISCNKEIQTVILNIDDALKPIKDGWIKKIILKMKGRHA